MTDVRWCACLPNTGWSCAAANGCGLDDAQQTPFDCSKANCDRTCVCDADGCGAMLEYSDVQIDAALSNDGEEARLRADAAHTLSVSAAA